jgi:hypothetical protein
MMASAKIEHAMSGHMGQPAACMMLDKVNLSTSGFSFDYGRSNCSSFLWITL